MTQSGQPGGSPPPPAASSPPPAASPPDWQSTPQQPSSPPTAGGSGGSSGTPSWTANITSQAPVAGPSGYFYADVPNRIIAYIIDFILLFIGLIIIALIVAAIMPAAGFAFALIYGLLAAALTAAYFIYTWVTMRGTLGMKVLGMQIGDQADGRTMTFNQGLIRYAVLYGPFLVADILGRLIPALSLILPLLSLVWFIVLLVTTAQSPTKQGIHDKYARTMVVKAARSVG